MELLKEKIGDLIINGYKDEYIFETMRKMGFYEMETLSKWLPVARGCRVLLDVGANLGNHSLYWVSNIPDIEIIAFEPYQANYICLQKNIDDNGFAFRIKLEKKALGSKRGFVKVVSVDQYNLGATAFQSVEEETEIELVTIDDYVNERHLMDVGFIKIDTEGFELAILEGMSETIKKHAPYIWVEVSYESYIEVERFLSNHDYILSDAMGFNMLYIPKSKPPFIFDDFTLNRFFDETLKYLTRTNLYYKNYTKTKELYEDLHKQSRNLNDTLSQSNAKYRASIESYKALNEKYIASIESYKTLNEDYLASIESYKALNEALIKYTESYNALNKEYYASTESYKALNEEYLDSIKSNDTLKQINDEYASELKAYVAEVSKAISLLNDLNRLLTSQQAQINSLRQENEQYRRKLSLITDTWYGKIAIACYKRLKSFISLAKRVGGK